MVRRYSPKANSAKESPMGILAANFHASNIFPTWKKKILTNQTTDNIEHESKIKNNILEFCELGLKELLRIADKKVGDEIVERL